MSISLRLRDAFRTVFDDDDMEIDDELSSRRRPDWDSTTNLNLMFAIEQEFDIQFRGAQFNAFRNVGELRHFLDRLAGSGPAMTEPAAEAAASTLVLARSAAAFEAPAGPQEAIKDALFRPMGIAGVYARTERYETLVQRLAQFIASQRPAGCEVFRFPPVMGRAALERHGYLKSFPNLLGCVCTLHGTAAEITAAADRHAAGGDWTTALLPAGLVLSPAACYPVYPIAAARGPLPPGGAVFDVACDCFRHEPSPQLDRLQSFRMREYVRIGTPEEVTAFRDDWLVRAQQMAETLGLPWRLETASDPFFGRVGEVMAHNQLRQSLKVELLVPLHSAERPTACMSFNCHLDHFGKIWGIGDAAGGVAHTGCVAFGMDRLAVALFWTHGLDTALWPLATRSALDL